MGIEIGWDAPGRAEHESLVERRYLSDHSIQLVLSTPGGSEQARSNDSNREVIELNAA